MNDDLLEQKAPQDTADKDTSVPNDTEEQDTVSDRVFDFSDGDIKPVTDLDGPVTHQVNLQVAEALRNPSKSVANPVPSTPPTPEVPTPTPKRSPINKLEEFDAPTATKKTIPHPPIDPSMQAPAVKVYSQVPHTQPETTPTLTPVVDTTIISPVKPTPKFVTEASATPKLPVKPAIPSTQKVPENPASAAALQQILKKVHSQTQAAPPIIKENLLDKNIGNLDATPFAVSTAQPVAKTTPPSPLSTGPQLVQSTPAPIPLQDIPSILNKERAVPANPPTKTIGTRPSDYIPQSTAQKPQTLQDAIGSVLPGDSPSNTPKPFQNQSGPFKPIRTYESDVAEAMSHRKTSTTSIALAEAKKTEGAERLSNDEKPQGDSRLILKLVMTLLILILLGGGAFAGYYLYSKSPLATSKSTGAVTQQGRPGIVRADSYAVIPVDNQLPSAILSRVRAEAAKEQAPGTIKEIILARKSTSGTMSTFTQIGAPEALSIFDIVAPDILARTITSDWMLGIYRGPTGQEGAFAIVTTNFFQNAFAGMLQWEGTIADDLKQYIYPSTMTGIANVKTPVLPPTISVDLDSVLPSTIPASTSEIVLTSTTTPTIPVSTSSTTMTLPTTTPDITEPLKQYFTIRGTFEDRIIKNKDVRAFRTETGSILFLYSFIDNAHLALASDEATLIEVLTRLERQALIR